jgi:CheY-like chemotaxis protein
MAALRKVLVVDDDPVVGLSFNRVLSDKGYIVVTAENGYDALMKLQNDKYDAVFTDIKMPGMDGLEVAERVKARQPWTPVVIVTGYGTKANEDKAKEVGVSEFLRKPLSPEMIEGSAAKAMLYIAPAPAVPVAAAVAAPAPAAAEPVAAPRSSTLKNMGLFLSAPFVGLAYALLLPFVGIGMLAWAMTQALMTPARAETLLRSVKFVAKAIAVPFAGLAFVALLPFIGMAMLAWVGGKLLISPPAAE